MSFILDALRKSEASRRRAEAPDLFAALPARSHAPARPAWPLWVAGLIAALSLAVATGLWLERRPPASAPATRAAATTDAARAARERAMSGRAMSGREIPERAAVEHATTDGMAADSTAADSTTPGIDAATGMPADAASWPAQATADASGVAPPPVPAARLPAAAPTRTPAPSAVPAAATPSAVASPGATPGPAAPRDTAQTMPPAASPGPPASPASPTPAPAPPSGDRIVALADLDPALRRQLPALKLSMHLWNDTPAQRFVVLDGQRLKEGDTAGEVVVERIQRDGVVLAWRGARLRIGL